MKHLKIFIITIICLLGLGEIFSLYQIKEFDKLIIRGSNLIGLQIQYTKDIARNSLISSDAYNNHSGHEVLLDDWDSSLATLKSFVEDQISDGENLDLARANEYSNKFRDLLFPILKTRSRTSSFSLSQNNIPTIIDAENQWLNSLHLLRKGLNETITQQSSLFHYANYSMIGIQIILLIALAFNKNEKAPKNITLKDIDDMPLPTPDLSKESEELAKLQEQLEENIKTLSLKDDELDQTREALKEAQKKIEEYNKQLIKLAKNLDKAKANLNNFAHMLSKDLKAPLRSVNRLSSELQQNALANDGQGDESTRTKFNELVDLVDNMENMISGILEYTNAGSKEVLQNVNTFDMVGDLVRFFKPPKEIRVIIHENLPTIKTDNLALKQIFYNLISNSLKYCDQEKGKIEVGCTEGAISYKFWVEDNGQGIPKEEQDKIFLLFEKGSNQKNKKGSGIGLALVKKIMEDKEQEIWVKSQEGKGARFTFTWPKELT